MTMTFGRESFMRDDEAGASMSMSKTVGECPRIGVGGAYGRASDGAHAIREKTPARITKNNFVVRFIYSHSIKYLGVIGNNPQVSQLPSGSCQVSRNYTAVSKMPFPKFL